MTVRALIIGGTQGLGLEIARFALQRGIEPVVTSRKPPTTIDIDGTEVRAERMNVGDAKSVQACMNRFTVQPSLNFCYLFYLPGVGLQGKLCAQTWKDISRTLNVPLIGLIHVLRSFHTMKRKSYHLVAVTSTTSWRVRPNEAAYGAAKAGQAQLARNFHQELVGDFPGSRTLIVHPGGMRTPFWNGSGVDTSKFLDPAAVAALIWDEIAHQEAHLQPALHELHVLRSAEGLPTIERGPKMPQ